MKSNLSKYSVDCSRMKLASTSIIVLILLLSNLLIIFNVNSEGTTHTYTTGDSGDGSSEGFELLHEGNPSIVQWDTDKIYWKSENDVSLDEIFGKSIPSKLNDIESSFQLSASFKVTDWSTSPKGGQVCPIYIGNSVDDRLDTINTLYASVIKDGDDLRIEVTYRDASNSHTFISHYPPTSLQSSTFTVTLSYLVYSKRIYAQIEYAGADDYIWNELIIGQSFNGYDVQGFTFDEIGVSSIGLGSLYTGHWIEGWTDDVSFDFHNELWNLNSFSIDEEGYSSSNADMIWTQGGDESYIKWDTSGSGEDRFTKQLSEVTTERHGDFFAEFDIWIDTDHDPSADDEIIPAFVGDNGFYPDGSTDAIFLLLEYTKSTDEYLLTIQYRQDSSTHTPAPTLSSTPPSPPDPSVWPSDNLFTFSVWYVRERNQFYVELTATTSDHFLLQYDVIAGEFDFDSIGIISHETLNKGLIGYTDEIITDLIDYVPTMHTNNFQRNRGEIWQNNINSPINWMTNSIDGGLVGNQEFIVPFSNSMSNTDCPDFSVEANFRLEDFTSASTASIYSLHLLNQDPNDYSEFRTIVNRQNSILKIKLKYTDKDGTINDFYYGSLEEDRTYFIRFSYDCDQSKIIITLDDTDFEVSVGSGFTLSHYGVTIRHNAGPGWLGWTKDIELFGGVVEYPRYFCSNKDIVHLRAKTQDTSYSHLSFEYGYWWDSGNEIQITANDIFLQDQKYVDDNLFTTDSYYWGSETNAFNKAANKYRGNIEALAFMYLLTGDRKYSNQLSHYATNLLTYSEGSPTSWKNTGGTGQPAKKLLVAASILFDAQFHVDVGSTYSKTDLLNAIITQLFHSYDVGYDYDGSDRASFSRKLNHLKYCQGMASLLLLGNDNSGESDGKTKLEIYETLHNPTDYENSPGIIYSAWIFLEGSYAEFIREYTPFGPEGGWNLGTSYYPTYLGGRGPEFCISLRNIISTNIMADWKQRLIDSNGDGYWDEWDGISITGLPGLDDHFSNGIMYYIHSHTNDFDRWSQRDLVDENKNYQPYSHTIAYDDGSDTPMALTFMMGFAIRNPGLVIPGTGADLTSLVQWYLTETGNFLDPWSRPRTDGWVQNESSLVQSERWATNIRIHQRLLSFDPSIQPKSPTDVYYDGYFPLSKYFPIAGIVIFRNGWDIIQNGDDYISPFVFSFKSGTQDTSHSHANQFGITLAGYGTEFIGENGYIREGIARDNSEFHNTINLIDRNVGDVGSHCSFVFDDIESDLPHIAYYENIDSSTGNLIYATHDGNGDWYTDTVDTGGDVGLYTSIAVSYGNPSISYYDKTNNDCYYAERGSWISEAEGWQWDIVRINDKNDPSNPTNGGTHTSINLDGSTAIISYCEAESETDGKLIYAAYDQGNNKFITMRVNEDSSNDVMYSNIRLEDSIYIGYYEETSSTTGKLMFAYWDIVNGQWENMCIDDGTYHTTTYSNNVGQYVSMEINPISVPETVHFSYYDKQNGDLMYKQGAVTNDDTAWNLVEPRELHTAGNIGLHTSLELTDSFIPYISYYEKSSTGYYHENLWCIKFEGGDWQNDPWSKANVERRGDVGQYSSLQLLDVGGTLYPYICYYDDNYDACKLSVWDGTNWDTTWTTGWLREFIQIPEIQQGDFNMGPGRTHGEISFFTNDDECSFSQGEFTPSESEELYYGYVSAINRSVWNLGSIGIAILDQVDVPEEFEANLNLQYSLFTDDADGSSTNNEVFIDGTDGHILDIKPSVYLGNSVSMELWGASTKYIDSGSIESDASESGSKSPKWNSKFTSLFAGDTSQLTLLIPKYSQSTPFILSTYENYGTARIIYQEDESGMKYCLFTQEDQDPYAWADGTDRIDYIGLGAYVGKRPSGTVQYANIIDGWQLSFGYSPNDKTMIELPERNPINERNIVTAFSYLDEFERTTRCQFKYSNGGPGSQTHDYMYLHSNYQTPTSVMLDGIIPCAYTLVDETVRVTLPSAQGFDYSESHEVLIIY